MDIKDMSEQEVARWISLMQTVNLIAEECERKGLDFNKVDLKPQAIHEYSEFLYDDIWHKHGHKKTILSTTISTNDIPIKLKK
jgi:hypothetical protein